MNKESCSKKITKNVKKQLSKNLQKKQIVVKKVRGNKKEYEKKLNLLKKFQNFF